MGEPFKKYTRLMKKFRRDLDQRAELGWQENETKGYIIRKLGKDFCWSRKTALIYKIGRGIPVFFRSELDALPTSSGAKHICGHSTHMAALMGAHMFFKKNPPRNFCIYFVFQPSEESFPSGARFISDNFREIRKCRAGFAFHVQPQLPLGVLADPNFAAGDYFEILIRGKGGHVKDKNSDHFCDALAAAGDLVRVINRPRSRGWIINVGVLRGGDAPNKVASEATLAGDIRTHSEKQRKDIFLWLKGVCFKYQKRNSGIKIVLRHYRAYPALKNDPILVKKTKKTLRIDRKLRSFGTEDFSLYPVPGVFLLIGTGSKAALHTDKFRVAGNVGEHILRNWIILGTSLEKIVMPTNFRENK